MIERLEKILEHYTGKKQTLNRDADLMKDLGLNSLELIELVVEIEEEFGISIEDREIQSLSSVDDVIRLIERKS